MTSLFTLKSIGLSILEQFYVAGKTFWTPIMALLYMVCYKVKLWGHFFFLLFVTVNAFIFCAMSYSQYHFI